MSANTTEAVRLLVVSREPSVLRPLWSIGESNAWHLETAGNGWEALERIQAGALPNLLLLELPRGDGDSLHVLRWLRRLRPELPVILLSHLDDLAHEKEALRLGAQGFLVQPFEEKRLESVIRQHLASSNDHTQIDFTSEDIEQVSDDTFFVGASPIMQKLRAQAELLAQANVPVLIVGEAGSGRDTTARLIHERSVRSGFRFLKVNCAALPADLLENELFGHRGSLSKDDGRASLGKFELCDKGTIFLDEIVEMPIGLQEKLLHVMQEKQFLKPGTGRSIDVDVRVLAATDMNIERALSEKRLREDLYYRLSAFTVHVPALRQRKDEIPFLLQHFMHKLARHYGLPAREFSPAVLDACQGYAWPGNVRELENFVKRYLMIGDDNIGLPGPDQDPAGEHIRSTRIPNTQQGFESDEFGSGNKSLKSLIHDVKTEAERNAIATALEKTGWNRKAAARLLKVSYRTMLYKIEQYHMSSADSYPSPFVNGTGFNGLKGNGHGLKGNGRG
jgi:two-component system, NtrC family, response regulator AtoC